MVDLALFQVYVLYAPLAVIGALLCVLRCTENYVENNGEPALTLPNPFRRRYRRRRRHSVTPPYREDNAGADLSEAEAEEYAKQL